MKRQSKRFEKLLVYSPCCCALRVFSACLQPILRLVHATRSRRRRLRKPFWRLIVKVTIKAKSHSPNRMNDELRLTGPPTSIFWRLNADGFRYSSRIWQFPMRFYFSVTNWQIGQAKPIARVIKTPTTFEMHRLQWVNELFKSVGVLRGFFRWGGLGVSEGQNTPLANCEIVADGRHTRSRGDEPNPELLSAFAAFIKISYPSLKRQATTAMGPKKLNVIRNLASRLLRIFMKHNLRKHSWASLLKIVIIIRKKLQVLKKENFWQI